MGQATEPFGAGRIHALAADGSAVDIPAGAVQAVTPDPDSPLRTRLHLGNTVVSVQGSFETWMSTLAARWSGSTPAP